MQYLRDDQIQLAFATMMNKLIFAHRWVLRPYLTELRKTTTDYALRRINELQSLLFKNTEQRETLSGLRTQGYIDHIIFSKENNALMTQAQEYREEIAMLNRTMTGDTSKVNETMALLRYAENAEMLTEFDEELFVKFVNRIVVLKRNEIGFELKCGLTLKERLD